MFERFNVVPPEVTFDVTAADLLSVAFDFYIGAVSEEALIVSVFFCCSGFVVVNDCFFVTPEVGCSCNRSSGSGQGVEQVFQKSSFSSSHGKNLLCFVVERDESVKYVIYYMLYKRAASRGFPVVDDTPKATCNPNI